MKVSYLEDLSWMSYRVVEVIAVSWGTYDLDITRRDQSQWTSSAKLRYYDKSEQDQRLRILKIHVPACIVMYDVCSCLLCVVSLSC